MLAVKGKFTCVVGNRNLKRLRENPLNKGLLWNRFKAGVYLSNVQGHVGDKCSCSYMIVDVVQLGQRLSAGRHLVLCHLISPYSLDLIQNIKQKQSQSDSGWTMMTITE